MSEHQEATQRPSEEQIADWVEGATYVFYDPLPAGHKLWKSWALDLAEGVLALARLRAAAPGSAEGDA